MPRYDYNCSKCETIEEITHSIHENPQFHCKTCQASLKRLVSSGCYIIESGIKESIADHKQNEHSKKVKDPERAVKSRKKAFGKDAVGDPSMQTDPRHIIKGRTLGGQQKEVDKREFIKAAAKDPLMVKKATDALKKAEHK